MINRLVIEDLAVERGGRRLFDGFSLELAGGEAVALTGANGAGKTSLLRVVAGLLRPASGGVRFERDGVAVEADEARADAVHLLGHHDGLKSARTAAEELAFWSAWTGADASRVEQAITTLHLAPLLDLEVRKLSAGQRKRVALARLVAAPRSLWLLDEPLAPLDAQRRLLMGELMQAHLTGGGMILAAVHDSLPIAARDVKVGA